MRVTHVNTTVSGGAARAVLRLHRGLRDAGVDSSVFVLRKGAYDPHIRAYQPVERVFAVARRNLRRRKLTDEMNRYRATRPAGHDWFSDDRTDIAALPLAQLPPADIVHLQWVAGFIDYAAVLPELAKRSPVVWTLHDMNPFTGGCHYDENCGRFTAGCGSCPQLGSTDPQDLSHAIWTRKKSIFDALVPGRLRLAVTSRWMAGEVARSPLLSRFPLDVIPLGLDTNLFFPRDRAASRSVLGIPPGARVVLFAADSVVNRRKGFAMLADAVAGISGIDDLLLVSLGETGTSLPAAAGQLHLGSVHDDRLLGAAYSAADVFVIPSLQEAFGQTALEAAACGTPSIAFDKTGLTDLIDPGRNGLLVAAGDVPALRTAIVRVLSDPALARTLGDNARADAVSRFGVGLMASRYRDLYTQALSARATTSHA